MSRDDSASEQDAVQHVPAKAPGPPAAGSSSLVNPCFFSGHPAPPGALVVGKGREEKPLGLC